MTTAVVAGPATLALGIAASTWSSRTLAPPVTMLLVVVPLVVFLALRRPGGARALALRRPGAALVGVGVVGGSAEVVLVVDGLAGGTRIVSVDLLLLATFVLVNGLTAAAQEAVPEELALRGYTVSVLQERCGVGATVVWSTLGFVAAALVGNAAGSAATGAVAVAPSGQHPVDYVVLLAVFGVVLALLRLVTGSVLAPIAGHLVFLLVNRVLVVPRADTGVVVETPPGAELLVPVYLVLAALVLTVVLLRRRRVSAANRAGATH